MVHPDRAYIGMRVVANSSDLNDGLVVEVGELGTICEVGLSLGVAWDKEHEKGHSCRGHCKSGHGWYVYPRYLDVLPDVVLPDVAVPDGFSGLI